MRAEYGKALIDTLAADLGLRHGKGFSRSNLIRFRQFYLAYPDLAPGRGRGSRYEDYLRV